MGSIKRIASASLFVLLTTASVCAEARVASSQSEDMSSSAPGAPKVKYFDLLRKLFPDLTAEATAHKTVPLRSLSEPRERAAIEGDIEFDFKPYWFKSEGRRLLMLWVNIKSDGANQATPYEGEAEVIAVYKLAPKVELLDALEVKTDRFTSFWKDRPTFRLDARNDAFIIYSTHWNAGESYLSLDMLFVDAGRIKRVASRFMYNTKGCGVSYEETPYFRAAADAGRKYPRVLLTMKLKKERDGPECDRRTRGYTKFYRGVYRWNAARGRYEGGSRQLDMLDKFDERRVSSP